MRDIFESINLGVSMPELSSKAISRFTTLRLVYWGCSIGCQNLDVDGSPVQRTISVTTGTTPMADEVLVNSEWLENADDEEFVVVLHRLHLTRQARVENWRAANPRSADAWSAALEAELNDIPVRS